MKSETGIQENPQNKCSLPIEEPDKLNDCPYCQYSVELVWVHGHYQCPNCKHVVVSCCGDS